MREAHAGEVAALLGRVNVAELFAAELRVQLDEVRGKLMDAEAAVRSMAERASQEVGRAVEAEADLRRELEAAQIALGEAQVDVAELKQAEAARAGKGRLARLRAAWRGE